MSSRRTRRALLIGAAARHAWGLGQLARARVGGQAFVCEALAGRSAYSVVINSDLTVSCNCNDTDGTGHLGDLARADLTAIFAGPRARHMRAALAAGSLPTTRCARCRELRRVASDQAQRAMERFTPPTAGLMVENTVACQLDCLGCDRDSARRRRRRVAMRLEDVARVADEVARLGLRQVSYYNLGEPFLSKRLGEELELFRARAPAARLSTSTNGLALDTDAARAAALRFDDLCVSIDGVSTEMVRRYQQGGDFDRAYANLRALVRFRDARGLERPVIVWKYVLFRWNDRPKTVARAIALGRAAGVDAIFFRATLNPIFSASMRFRAGALDGLGRRVPGGLSVVLRPGGASAWVG